MIALPQSMRVTSSPSFNKAASSWSSQTSCWQFWLITPHFHRRTHTFQTDCIASSRASMHIKTQIAAHERS
jgi:hypothetical protein